MLRSQEIKQSAEVRYNLIVCFARFCCCSGVLSSGNPSAPLGSLQVHSLCPQRGEEPRGLCHFRFFGGSTMGREDTNFVYGPLVLDSGSATEQPLSLHGASVSLATKRGSKCHGHWGCCNLTTHDCPGPSTGSGTLKMLSKCRVISPCTGRGRGV